MSQLGWPYHCRNHLDSDVISMRSEIPICDAHAPLTLPSMPANLRDLDDWIDAREISHGDLKSDNQARIVWSIPSLPVRTPYALVYLHGFSASQGEANPVHRELAAAIGANLYLARLPGHGLSSEDAFRDLSARQWIEAAAEALAIGLRLGERVILAGTSMGASLALLLAAEFPNLVDALLLWSPGIRAYDQTALDSACQREGVVYRDQDADPIRLKYWSTSIHSDGLRAMATLLAEWMVPGTFNKVRCPLLMGYFYQDTDHQDMTSSVSAMLAMLQSVSTPAPSRRVIAYPDGAHALAAPSRSTAWQQLMHDSKTFLQERVIDDAR